MQSEAISAELRAEIRALIYAGIMTSAEASRVIARMEDAR
jgi:hypothetical protein